MSDFSPTAEALLRARSYILKKYSKGIYRVMAYARNSNFSAFSIQSKSWVAMHLNLSFDELILIEYIVINWWSRLSCICHHMINLFRILFALKIDTPVCTIPYGPYDMVNDADGFPWILKSRLPVDIIFRNFTYPCSLMCLIRWDKN